MQPTAPRRRSFLPTRSVQADPGRGEDDGDAESDSHKRGSPHRQAPVDVRGEMAISAAPRRRAPTSDQAPTRKGSPPSTGISPNTTVPSAIVQKPQREEGRAFARRRGNAPSRARRRLRDDRDRGVEDEPGSGRIRGLERGAQREERGPRREQSHEHDLAQQPGAVALRARAAPYPLFGNGRRADKRTVTERIHRGRPSADEGRPRVAS